MKRHEQQVLYKNFPYDKMLSFMMLERTNKTHAAEEGKGCEEKVSKLKVFI